MKCGKSIESEIGDVYVDIIVLTSFYHATFRNKFLT